MGLVLIPLESWKRMYLNASSENIHSVAQAHCTGASLYTFCPEWAYDGHPLQDYYYY